MGEPRSLKREFLLDPSVTFLNHGSFGACPRPVMEAFHAWQLELEREPVELLLRRGPELLEGATAALAAYVGCATETLALVPNATVGMNMVARSLKLREGDRVVSTDHEYGAVDRLWQYVCERSGATFVPCALPAPVTGADGVVEAIAGELEAGARVVSISHITSPTGVVLPVEEVCALAREAGAITVVDGAHGPGQLDLELASLGCDFYVGNCHKWLCSPKIAGFLYSDPGCDVRVDPLVLSWGWDEPTLAERMRWPGTQDLSAYLSIEPAIRFQAERDWPAVRARCVRDAAHLHERLLELPGVTAVAATPMLRQMVSVLLPPETREGLQQWLFDEHAIEVPVNPWHGGTLLRASVAAYNERDELDRFVDALARWARPST